MTALHAQFGNGDVSDWTFEPKRIRLTSLVTTLANTTRVQDLHYSYDPTGNPLAINNTLPASPTNNTLPGTATQSFTYDGVDRLTHATGSGTVGGGTLNANKTTTYDLTFAYTPSHNIANKTLANQVITNNGSISLPPASNYASSYTYSTARPHLPTQVGALAIVYDPSGNPITRTSDHVEHLVWDDDNRLVQDTTPSVSQRNLYDAAGLRVVRNGSAHTIFASSLFEFDTVHTGTKHVFAGQMRVASVLGTFAGGANPMAPTNKGTAFFFHENHLGSTGVVTTEGGDVNDAHEYFPDGAAWIDSGKAKSVDGFLFSGKPFDADTGFYDFGQRFYDPRLSLWLGVDSAFKGAASSAVSRPFVLSTLSFSAQNPLHFVDKDGRDVSLEEQANGVCYADTTCKGGSVDWYGHAEWVKDETGEHVERLSGVNAWTGWAEEKVAVQKAAVSRLADQGRSPTDYFRRDKEDAEDELNHPWWQKVGKGIILAATVAAPILAEADAGEVGAFATQEATADATVSAPSLADLSRAAGAADRGGLTAAGRALQKHGGRPGSAFPTARGNPAQINQAGQGIVDDILANPGSTTATRHHARFGDVIEIRAPDGRGVRYDANGRFIGLLEP